jgi:hypothetical protein
VQKTIGYMKILNNSSKRIPKVGDKITAPRGLWNNDFFIVGDVFPCTLPSVGRDCRKCESKMRLRFKGYAVACYCAEEDWKWEE